MSDRLYLFAVPQKDASKIKEFYSTAFSLPFEPYVANGVLYNHGSLRPNPRYDELAKFVFKLPSVYIAKWPSGHLARLFWKWNLPRKTDYLDKVAMGLVDRGTSLPLRPKKATTLLKRQLPRAQSTGEVTLDDISSVLDFLAAHPTDHFFLDIG